MLILVKQRDRLSHKKIANEKVIIELEEIIQKLISKFFLNGVKKDNEENLYKKALRKIESGFSLTYIFPYKNRTCNFALTWEIMRSEKTYILAYLGSET